MICLPGMAVWWTIGYNSVFTCSSCLS